MASPGRPDRELRRLVAALARRTPDEVGDILAELAPARAQRVKALLAQHVGGASPAVEAAAEIWADLSPWLAARAKGEAATCARYAMTGAAREALNEAVKEVAAARSPAAKAAPPGDWRSLLRQVFAR